MQLRFSQIKELPSILETLARAKPDVLPLLRNSDLEVTADK
jgi:hypothetical protein